MTKFSFNVYKKETSTYNTLLKEQEVVTSKQLLIKQEFYAYNNLHAEMYCKNLFKILYEYENTYYYEVEEVIEDEQ
jgi:hypothetical protein